MFCLSKKIKIITTFWIINAFRADLAATRTRYEIVNVDEEDTQEISKKVSNLLNCINVTALLKVWQNFFRAIFELLNICKNLISFCRQV